MNKSEMIEIVSMCSALDGQLVSESKVIMWLAMFEGYSYGELVAGISQALKAKGVPLGDGPIRNHRRGSCRCRVA